MTELLNGIECPTGSSILNSRLELEPSGSASIGSFVYNDTKRFRVPGRSFTAPFKLIITYQTIGYGTQHGWEVRLGSIAPLVRTATSGVSSPGDVVFEIWWDSINGKWIGRVNSGAQVDLGSSGSPGELVVYYYCYGTGGYYGHMGVTKIRVYKP